MDLSDQRGQNDLLIESLINENANDLRNIDKIEKDITRNIKDYYQAKREYEQLTAEIQKFERETENYKNIIVARAKEDSQKKKETEEKLVSKINSFQLLEAQAKNLPTNKNEIKEKEKYLETKFSNEFYEPEYVKKCLTKDILDFYKIIKQTNKPKEKFFPLFINNLNHLINSRYYAGNTITYTNYTHHILVFGSYACNLFLPYSDLDLLIEPPQGIPDINFLQEIMVNLGNIEKDKITNIQLMANNSFYFPYIYVQTNENYGKITVRICINTPNHNPRSYINYMQMKLNLYPILEPLTMVTKNFFHKLKFIDYEVSLFIFNF